MSENGVKVFGEVCEIASDEGKLGFGEFIERSTYQRLLMSVDINKAGPLLPTLLVDAKILAECIDEDKCLTSEEYYERFFELEGKSKSSSSLGKPDSTLDTGRFTYDYVKKSLVLDFDKPLTKERILPITADVDIPCDWEDCQALDEAVLIVDKDGQVGAIFS